MTNAPPNPKDLPSAVKRYRIQHQHLVVTPNGMDDLSVSEVASESRWTRGSVSSSFINGELGSTLGRLMRSAGRLIIDPIDTFIGLREFGRLYAYVIRLDVDGWQRFTTSFDIEAYAPRIAEVLRHQIYPRKLQLLAQKITLAFAIFGKVRFEVVESRIHFRTRVEFQESITDLCTTSLDLLPKSILLLHLPITDGGEDFLSCLRRQINLSSDEAKVPQDCTLLYLLIDQTRKIGARVPESDLEREVEMLKLVLGEEHPVTLRGMNKLAGIYCDQRLLKDSEELTLVVLEKRKRAIGEEHPDTLTTMQILGAVYHKQGRLKDAEELNLAVLEKRKRSIGKEHPDTLYTMHNLAMTYHKQGRLNEAEILEIAVLEKYKQVLNEEHPHGFDIVQGLAATYCRLGRFKEAEELNLALLVKRKRAVGKEHPDTLSTMHSLSVTYHQQG